MDFRQSSCFFNNAKIYGGSDFKHTAGSRIIILTSGVNRKKGSNEARNDLLVKNVDIFKEIIPKIMEHNKNPIFLVVSNPEGVLAHLTWKLSQLPVQQVIGLGTMIDTSRFTSFLCEKFCVSHSEVKGWIIGEHGEKCVCVWSGLDVGGIRVRDVCPTIGKPEGHEEWLQVHKDVIGSGLKLISLKGHTNWNIASCVAALVSDIFHNTGCIRAVSTEVSKILYKNKEFYMVLPYVVDQSGVASIVKLNLDPDEEEALCESADSILKVMEDAKF